MTILTTTEYWDCECERDYIHSRASDICVNCGARRFESPDSRVSEVELYRRQLFVEKEKIDRKPKKDPKYLGVLVEIHHNGGNSISLKVVNQDDPYYNPIEALESVIPYIRTLHNVVRINFRHAYD